MDYGDRLKELRTKRKLSQQDLADRLKINRSTYARYELGQTQPDYDTLQKLADFFDVSIDYLLGRTNDPNYGFDEEDDEIENLLKDEDFMIAYKEMPGTPEEAKEELIRFMKYLKYEEEKKKRK